MLHTSTLKSFLHRACTYVLIYALTLQHLVATEIVMNHVLPHQSPEIQPKIDHPRHYALNLDKNLWQEDLSEPVVLRHQNTPLAIISREAATNTLVFQALCQDMFPDSPLNYLKKPAHFHFYKGAEGKVFWGKIRLESKGRLSFYGGEYSQIQAEGSRLFLKKDPRFPEERITIIGSGIFQGKGEITQKAPVSMTGNLSLTTRKLTALENFKVKKKGIMSASKIVNRKNFQFGHDTVFRGLEENGFKKLSNSGKIMSRGTLLFIGDHMDQQEQGGYSAGQSLQLLLQTLHGKGKFSSPFLNFTAQQGMRLEKTHLNGCAIFLTSPQIGFVDATLEAKNGMHVKATKVDGWGTFQVGGHKKWSFPPKAGKKGEIPSLEGCTWEVASLHLDERSAFHLYAGPTVMNTVFANLKGKVISGIYNHHPVQVEGKDWLSVEGFWKTYEAYLAGAEGDLKGEFQIDRLTTTIDRLKISGNIQTESFCSKGRHLQLAASGKLKARQTSLNQGSVSLKGEGTLGNLKGNATTLEVGSSGAFSFTKAHLDILHTQILGQMTGETLSIAGSSVDVGPQGNVMLGHVNNQVPSWNVSGKGTIGTFDSATPTLTLKGEEGLRINQATVQAESASLRGRGTIDRLDYQGKTLATSGALKGGSWDITAQRFSHSGDNFHLRNLLLQATTASITGSGSIDYLRYNGDALEASGALKGSTWDVNARRFSLSGNNFNIGRAHIHADSASISGNGTLDRLSYYGDTFNASGTLRGSTWDVNARHFSLSGNNFNIGRANIHADQASISGNGTLDRLSYYGETLNASGSFKGSTWDVNARRFSLSGNNFNIGSANIEADKASMRGNGNLDHLSYYGDTLRTSSRENLERQCPPFFSLRE